MGSDRLPGHNECAGSVVARVECGLRTGVMGNESQGDSYRAQPRRSRSTRFFPVAVKEKRTDPSSGSLGEGAGLPDF